MYLSKIHLTGQYAKNSYEYHNGLWKLFSDTPDRQRDFLYRVEQKQRGRVALLVQSCRPLQTVDSESINVLASKAWQPVFHQGQCLRFFIHANPVKTIKDAQQRVNKKGQIKSCRVPLIDFEEQQQWLIKRLTYAARIEELDINPLEPLYFRKQKTGAGKIQPVRYQGVLTVIDPEQMKILLETGMGPGKAFGCGMLSLAPAG
ncbi:MAG: type I-E CRISPR-associated protein Cas6/Cse3/CasE [Gammaproteobacteria bacterium]|nr:type I-E CRISPR-associated protein Cas6/Cse3/CasE [Gammaproteobacteria bacterium]